MAAGRLSELPLLSQPLAGSLKGNSRRVGAAALAPSSAGHIGCGHQMPLRAPGPEQSTLTAASAKGAAAAGLMTGKSGRSAAGTLHGAVADEVLLPGEYVKVVELLKKRGEKGHKILAQNEVRRNAHCVQLLGKQSAED